MVVIVKVTDLNGEPISGATVTFQGCCLNDPFSSCKILGVNVKNPDFSLINETDSAGEVRFYTGCMAGLQFSGTVSATGYQSKNYSGTLQAFSSEVVVNVALPSAIMPTNNNGKLSCPQGYSLQNGECVQNPKASYTASIFDSISKFFESLGKEASFIIFAVIIIIMILAIAYLLKSGAGKSVTTKVSSLLK